jgi:hypothetical protein
MKSLQTNAKGPRMSHYVIHEAVRKYSEMKQKNYLRIGSAFALMEMIKDVINIDIRRWIVDEGAYRFINDLARKQKRQAAEDFISKSIKSQIELALLKRGIRETEIRREEQLVDNDRIDFSVSYGFVGTVLIELKLARNDEANANRKRGREYVEKLKKYISGSCSDYGIFLVFNVDETLKDDVFIEQMQGLQVLYQNEKNIAVMGMNCF